MEKIQHQIFSNKTPQGPEIEEYLKSDAVKLKKDHLNLNDTSKAQKGSKIANLKESKTDNNHVAAAVGKNETSKPMEHSKSKEKIIQQAFFSNINNSYGSLTAQKNPNLRNVSSGGIKTPNSENFPNNIGVSYNVNSVRSPKINNNFGAPNTTQKVAISKVL